MFQIDEDVKRYRSIKLCQLVYERQIDGEIGFEIRKLLEEGVLIDFQDQNRNNKTAIHLAVEKCDVICVKFLLRFTPNLEVKDENEKTPVELAESNDDKSILNALLNSTVDVVNESYVEAIDFGSLTPQKIEAIKSRASFKVLKLTNCPSADKVWEKLSDQGYAAAFNETSHLFFIAIETKQTNIDNDSELMKKVLKLRRPMIVQLTSPNNKQSKIYFKDDSEIFVEITDTQQITQEEFDEAIQSDGKCNFKLLFVGLRSNLFGHFTGDLLDTKLKTNQDRMEAVNQFAGSNALCHRFFKLFDESPTEIVTTTFLGRVVAWLGLSAILNILCPNLLRKLFWRTSTSYDDSESPPDVDRIVATLSFKGDQSLLALLDLPFELKNEKLELNVKQQDILGVVDSSGCNLLMLAAELNNLDAVKLLLRCGCDFNHSDNYDKRASDICWQIKAFDCLAELIEAGSPFPSNFRLDEVDQTSEAHERVNKMIEAINSFHANIKQGGTKEVEKFITSNPHIKYAFDMNNKCALTVALESDEVDIHSLLLSEGFEPGADDEYYEVLVKFDKKSKIRTSHKKYFKEAFDEPHLKRLLSKFRLSFGSKDRAKCSTIIRRMFDELNEIDELIPILQICSLSDKLRIVFDFNCDSVVDMDPTNGEGTLGIVYFHEGFIYVGAKNHKKEFFKVIGTLIHELTHYAMKLTYENACKPYDENDVENKNRFEAITRETKKICDEIPSTDAIVSTVFSLYSEEVWHAELIVRVPHLLAHLKMSPKLLKAAERKTPELFHFYRDQTLKDIERRSKVLLQKYLISKINNQTGIARKIENLNVKFENAAIDLKPSVNVIASNAPQMTLAMLKQDDCEYSHIFVTLEQIALGNILDKIAKVNAKGSSTALIVDCIGQAEKYQESLGTLMKSMKNIKTIALVLTAAESLKVKKDFFKIESKTFAHKWDELTESSKVHLLDQNVIFQGVEVKLNELVEPSSEAMNFFPLGELVDLKEFKIGHELHQISHKFYIPRKFIQKCHEGSTRFTENAKCFEQILRVESKMREIMIYGEVGKEWDTRKIIEKAQQNAKSFEKLLQDQPKMGSMIFSDDAGSGKSVALFEIAKSLHDANRNLFRCHQWVLFVDLKRHIEAFKSVEDHEKIESFEDFIVQNILNNEPEFDRELFVQMFKAGKICVLLDGFDEICPNYNELLLHVLKLFQPELGNQLFITTRPHLEADLEGVLGKFVFKLEELSNEDQRKFLRNYWQSVEFESDKDFEVLSDRLLAKFNEISSLNIVGLPLLLRMTAEIFADPIKENLLHKVKTLSIASVFEKFVEKYFMRWGEKGSENEIPREERVKIDMAGGILAFHHRIAINHIFGRNFMPFQVGEEYAVMIGKVGLIRYHKTEKTFQFTHETFAEYFVANFIWFHLNRKNRDPSHDSSKPVEILIEVLLGDEFGVIQTFLDQILRTMKFNPSEAFCKSVAKCLSEIVKSRNRFNFLPNSWMFKSGESLASLLLSIAKHFDRDLLSKILRKKPFEASVLHYAAVYESKAIVSTLCDVITTCTDNPKEIYQEEVEYENVLLQAARNKNAGVLTTLCEKLNSEELFTENEIKTMFRRRNRGENIVTWTAYNNHVEVYLELISLLPKYFSPGEIKRLFRVGCFTPNFFQQALAHNASESFKVMFEVVKANFDLEDQKNFFYKPATGPNMFHYAAQNQTEKIFETLIESTLDVLSVDEIKSMLRQKDSDGSNVLHKIAQHANEIKLKEINLLLRERLSDNEIRSLLLEVNREGQNCFRLAANNTKLSLQVFCENIGNLLPIEDQTRLLQQSITKIDIIRLAYGSYNSNEIVPSEAIEQLLLTKKYEFRRNVFHEAAKRGDVETWDKLISFAQARFSADKMKSFLFCEDEDGLNCLHLAVSRESHESMIGAICKTIKAVLSVEEQKEFVRQKDSRNKNLFHLAVECHAIPFWFALYDALRTILSNDEIKEMLKEKDSRGDNILCSNIKPSLLIRRADVSSDLISFLQKILANDELKSFLFDVDSEGRNFFHCTVEISSIYEIVSLSTAIKGILSRDDQKKFFGVKSPNVFHLAVRNPFGEVFWTLRECLKDVFEADELRTLVTSSDNDGRNVLLLAAQFNDSSILEELISFIQNELSIDDQRNLIQKCDNDGKNIFTFLSRKRSPEIYSVVKKFAKEILTKNQIKELKNRNMFGKYFRRNRLLSIISRQQLDNEIFIETRKPLTEFDHLKPIGFVSS